MDQGKHDSKKYIIPERTGGFLQIKWKIQSYQMKKEIKEKIIKSALSPSKLPGLDYALNPYRGCEHACVYCYAPSVIHWDKGKWGELVEAKVNLPRILSKELRARKKALWGLERLLILTSGLRRNMKLRANVLSYC